MQTDNRPRARWPRPPFRLAFGLVCLGLVPMPAGAQDSAAARPGSTARPDTVAAADTTAPSPVTYPVVLRGDTIAVFTTGLGPFSAAERAEGVRQRIRRVARTRHDATDSMRVVTGAVASDILFGSEILVTVTDADAEAAGIPRDSLVGIYASRIAAAVETESWTALVRIVLRGVLLTLLAIGVFYVLLRALGAIFPRVYRLLGFWRKTRIPALRIQRLELLSASRITDILIWLSRALHVVLVVALLYFFVPLVLSFFPWTQNLADRLLAYVVQPFGIAFRQIIDYLPNLLTIAVVVIITRYLLVLIHLVFRGVEREAISFPNFHPEWAEPTYKIVRFLVLIFSVILIWDKLPGSDSDAFAGVSVFVGLLISLGSASAIANVVAGVVITYMRPFRVGDRVKIADTVGDVVEKTLLVTRVRTTKNVDVTVPNALVLGAHIINYSSSAGDRGVLLHTSVTIGYDVPWRRVHKALIAAAHATEGVNAEPEPFVLQTALGDYAVAYELNAATATPSRMAAIYSALHENIQDRCAAAGIEIMSPAYTAVRDGNRAAIPEEALGADYAPPAFRVRLEDDAGGTAAKERRPASGKDSD